MTACFAGGRRHAFLENVVTHPELRGRGFDKAVVQASLAHAWATDCHHVLMQSARTTHECTPSRRCETGLRVAYVARRPAIPAGRLLTTHLGH
ncbi:GNAT family N-acetyltransferase [Mesorhizobium sp. L48C026A00]|uniref:GNAT family N-acetyltransferase n=1 Tax=Mesorhizobium sp. L48C026A00 TaxID=1287182 RepID=UPI00358DF462